MSQRHAHEWTVVDLVEHVPGIPAYVTSCACGVLRPVTADAVV